jgi:hypothetical protein
MADLSPIDPSLVPFAVGEKFAFQDNPDHPGYDEGRAALYGLIEQIGLDGEGKLAFDLALVDPETGEWAGGTKTIYRAGMEDIQ